MEFATWLNIFIGFVLILAMFFVALIQYMRITKSNIFHLWEKLHIQARKRTDMLPLILERAKGSGLATDSLLAARQIALHEKNCNGKRIAAEQELSEQISLLEQAIAAHAVLKNDMIIDAMFKEIHKQEALVKSESEHYNGTLRAYNRLLQFPGLAVALKALNFTHLPLFNF